MGWNNDGGGGYGGGNNRGSYNGGGNNRGGYSGGGGSFRDNGNHWGGNRGNYGNRNNNNYGGNRGNYNNGSNYQNNEPIEVSLYKAYVGTGNKEAPSNVLETMKRLSSELSGFGYTLRTGGLDGPDQAFEDGDPKCELYLPWRGFNNRESKLTFNTPESLGTARMFHTGFDGLKPAIQAFLAKNARMVLGKDMRSPAMFVLCWSEDGAEHQREKTQRTGNVGHVIAIANALKIPVFNLGKPDAETRLKTYLELSHVEDKQAPIPQSATQQFANKPPEQSDHGSGGGREPVANFSDDDFDY